MVVKEHWKLGNGSPPEALKEGLAADFGQFSPLDPGEWLSLSGSWCFPDCESLIYAQKHRTSLVAQTVKRLSTMRETRVKSLGWEDPLEKEIAVHSSTLAWKIAWTEEPGRLQSMGSQRVRHDWVTSLLLLSYFIIFITYHSLKLFILPILYFIYWINFMKSIPDLYPQYYTHNITVVS